MSYNTKNYTEQGGETTHIGGKLVFDSGGTAENLPLPIASGSQLGGVKLSNGLAASSDGTVSVAPATADSIGGIKVGNGLHVEVDGELSVAGATTEAIGGVKMAANIVKADGTDLASLTASVDELLTALKNAGIMEDDAQE